MELDIFNLRDFIKANHLKQVTSPIALTPTKMPSENGIFSYEIFGYTTEDRKNTFAYIELNDHFIHPQCYATLMRLGSLGKILTREKYAIIVENKIHILKENEIENYPDAETGIEFYYNNWDKIKWNNVGVLTTDKTDEEEQSADKKTRLNFLKLLKKDEVFVDCWLVLPPYYRDINSEDTTLGDDMNKVYNELISRANSLKSGFGFSSFSTITKTRIQQLLIMLYNISMGPVTGKSVDIKNNGELKGTAKRSLIRKNLLGRNIDFGGYSVIVSPSTSIAETVDDFAKFGYVTLPLQTVMSMMKPFFVNYCVNFIEQFVGVIKGIYGNRIVKFDSSQWSVDEIDRTIGRFIKSAADKDTPITLKFYIRSDDKKTILPRNTYIRLSESKTKDFKNSVERCTTWLDLFYMAAIEICQDKYSIVIRHPVTNFQNSYPAKIVVNSTIKSRELYVAVGYEDETYGSKYNSTIRYYKNYPYIKYDQITKAIPEIKDPDPKPDTYYDLIRAAVLGNACIKSLGADYD